MSEKILSKVTTSEEQTMENIQRLFNDGFDMYEIVTAEFFKNFFEYPSSNIYSVCEHCGSKYKDPELEKQKREKIDAYRKEDNRLYNMFKEALFKFYDLDGSQKRIQRGFEIAWDRGHSSGYGEVANVFEDLVDLLG